MIIDESHENYTETKLYNDVMGIALAVWGNVGDCPIFRHMDKALDNFDLDELRLIREAFETLPAQMQRDVMADIKTEHTIIAIDRLAHNIGSMSMRSRTA